ncbi:MAG: ABC transporter permease [Tannerella sp.]|jgi:NitT/TauT family transport system permease protein|nr:ABC transporter permease [Tannerella sp.]
MAKVFIVSEVKRLLLGGEVRLKTNATLICRKNGKQKYAMLLPVTGIAIAVSESIFLPDMQAVNSSCYQSFLVGSGVVFTGLSFFSFFGQTGLSRKLQSRSLFIFAVFLFLGVWDLLSTKSDIMKLPFFPGPAQIASIIVSERSTLLISGYYSMRLFFAGLILGSVFGIITGILIGWYSKWNYWLFPIIKLTGVIPSVAWIPIAVVIFPNSFITGVFLIIMASLFPIALMVSTGISSTPKTFYEVAKTLGANEQYLLFRVAIPNAVPSILTGISTATGISFLTLIVSEMVGAKAGLGWYINWAKAWSSYDKVYASIIIMAVIFSVIIGIITLIKNRLLRWQKGITK